MILTPVRAPADAPLLLGLDIGTSGTKCVLINTSGEVFAEVTSPYEPHRPQPGWSQQDPSDWWKAAVTAVGQVIKTVGVDASRIAAVGLSGQMHGSVLLGRDAATSGGQAEAICDALLWNDQRTDAQCREIESAVGSRRELVERVANAALPGFTLPKLLWIRQNLPEVWGRAAHVLLPKDYIAYRLTGVVATDVGDASGTLLFDVARRTWHTSISKTFGIDPEMLPQALESHTVVGMVTAAASSLCGLPVGTPVIIGSGDNQAAAIGAGAVTPGTAVGVLGTSGVILAPTDRPLLDLGSIDDPPTPAGRVHTMCAAAGPASWCMTGCTLSAGFALSWAKQLIAPELSFDEFLHTASQAPAGAAGLCFVPHLTGERCPTPDAFARAAWVGLTATHKREHLCRAVIEGVTASMANIITLMEDCGVNVHGLRVSGGGNRSPFWRQLQADIYGLPISTTNNGEVGSALGAAILAGVGVGIWPSVQDACDACVRVTSVVEPDTDSPAILRTLPERLAAVYMQIKPLGRILYEAEQRGRA